ncbi:TPA: DUF551 domain-containing protein [Escherichia coli]|nr:DUF551 domain-containing protein [Escherichia coli]KUS77778.1 hypothetical protein AWE76_03765 [Escherichia coli]MBV4946403.1 DUF551 domain-containing protein [Escherichia coli]MCW3833387.1 DUF551 domain-containing protein [Escherichia coli]HCY2066614.1 DUF551 domain-containing protein [Escherichia coli]HDY2091816.1 DUF551 domain-containing protein [Escherichia coli]
MITFTDKELIKEIKERIGSLDVRDNIELRAYEIALASLEAEPIGFRCRRNDNLGDWSYVYHREPDDFERKHLVIEGIYAAPPAPVVPEEATPENVEMLSGYVSTYKLTDSERDIAAEIWNACRTAMLHSAEPASNHEELPLDYLQGQKDGLEWAAQLAEANHPQTGDWLYDDPLELAKAIRKGPDMPEFDGPTPVTPDGWISCSERMPNDKQYVWCWGKSYGWTECDTFEGYYDWSRNKWWAVTDDGEEPASKVTHWMPLPEPPQEVK